MTALATISPSESSRALTQAATGAESVATEPRRRRTIDRAYISAMAHIENLDRKYQRPATTPLLPAAPVEQVIVLQDWEGVVEEVRDDDFVARLMDKTAAKKFDSEAAEIPKSEVDMDDIDLVKPGAIFYLTVFRRVLRNGRQERITRLIFRRLPAWTPSMLKSVEDRANSWKTFFGVGKSNSTMAG